PASLITRSTAITARSSLSRARGSACVTYTSGDIERPISHWHALLQYVVDADAPLRRAVIGPVDTTVATPKRRGPETEVFAPNPRAAGEASSWRSSARTRRTHDDRVCSRFPDASSRRGSNLPLTDRPLIDFHAAS